MVQKQQRKTKHNAGKDAELGRSSVVSDAISQRTPELNPLYFFYIPQTNVESLLYTFFSQQLSND